MALRIDIGDIDEDKWQALYCRSLDYCVEYGIRRNGSGERTMDIFIFEKYGAKRVSMEEIYEFPSKEKYTEFLLTWM